MQKMRTLCKYDRVTTYMKISMLCNIMYPKRQSDYSVTNGKNRMLCYFAYDLTEEEYKHIMSVYWKIRKIELENKIQLVAYPKP